MTYSCQTWSLKKRHSKKGESIPEKNGEKNFGPKTDRQNTKLHNQGKN